MKGTSASLLTLVFCIACGGEKTYEPKDFRGKSAESETEAPAREKTAPPAAVSTKEPIGAASVPSAGLVKALKGGALLVAQSRFKADEDGQFTEPDAAEMLILYPSGASWAVTKIEDKESNVFHKAIQYGEEGILTLGGNQAMLKLWRAEADKWQAQTLWHPKFGGTHNRLRDVEVADFNGDKQLDLAIATHDQGVVAVIWRRGDKWEPEELDRNPNTFVHEIEIGDLDRDGKFEIYATPSEPNTVTAEKQGGKVVRFAWDGNKFEKSEVVSFEDRHVKEILVDDVDGDGVDELYAALEAKVDESRIVEPVEILRYDLKDGVFESTKVASINDRFCRFLVGGDIDKDGRKELVAAAFSTGVWLIEGDKGSYKSTCIDQKSGGFEHAAYITDLGGDGQAELYVADDRRGVINVYEYIAGSYRPKMIYRRAVPSEAMVWNITKGVL